MRQVVFSIAVTATLLAAADGWAAVPAVVAKPTPAPRMSLPPADTRFQDWITTLSRWNTPLQALLLRQGGVLQAVNTGVGTALAYSSRPTRDEGRVWAESWTQARTLQIEELKAEAARVSVDPPAPPPMLANEPSIQGMLGKLRNLAELVRRETTSNAALAQSTVERAGRAAAGDATAARGLDGDRQDLLIAMISSENIVLQGSAALLGEGDPTNDLAAASIAGNLAMISYLQLAKAGATTTDRTLLVREIRNQAGIMQGLANRIPLDMASTIAAAGASPSMAGTVVLARMKRTSDVFSESADVERRIAQALVEMASLLERGEAPSSQGVRMALSSAASLIQTRLSLVQRRQQIMAGDAP